jgi:hypothetical protein
VRGRGGEGEKKKDTATRRRGDTAREEDGVGTPRSVLMKGKWE